MRTIQDAALRILLALYSVEAALAVLLAGLYKAPLEDWTRLSPGIAAVLAAGGAGMIGSVWLLLRQAGGAGAAGRRAWGIAVAANLLSWVVAAALSESVVRGAARRTPQGIVVGGVTLRPSWSEVAARSREVLEREETYFGYDPELGWSVGPSRQSRDGVYASSVEGLRSARRGVRLGEETPRHRVALVGDSNAFSLEVPFEDSWGHHLQHELGDDVQVLNFGVDGFGIDQMYLRYRRDVRPFAPDVVVVAFIEHDLARTLAVYPMVSFGWPGYLVKPRFVLEEGELRLLNMPLPGPADILSARRVDELPYVEYDPAYRATDWSWRFEHGPFFLRLLTSAFPRWPAVDARATAEESEALNSRLLVALDGSIEEDGAASLLLYLPHWGSDDSATRATIARAGVPVLDMTECLAAVPADGRKVPSGAHYTGLANRELARCTARMVAPLLRPAGQETGGSRG